MIQEILGDFQEPDIFTYRLLSGLSREETARARTQLNHSSLPKRSLPSSGPR
jgi:hypothetical protein